MARLVLKLLGQVQITLDNQPLTGFESDKSRALLIYLATEPPRLHRRETLAALLWPNVLESSARQSLSQALSNLRKVLKEHDAANPFFIATREGVQLNPEASIASDVATLRNARAGNGQASLPDIVELYGGPFLEGFTLAGGDGFEEWMLLQRESLQREAIEALDTHIERRLKIADLTEAIRAARRQLELDPWREESHRFLMRAYALNGQRGDAIAQYEKCRKALAEELRIEPSAATRQLVEDIRAGKIVATNRDIVLATEPSTSRAVAPRPAAQPKIVGLPRALTPFIGRAREVEALSELLISPDTRLVTVLGMGGMGKTRLSIQAATQVLNHFENGIVFVPLAAVNNAEQMAVAIIAALGASANQQHDWPALMDNLTNTLGEKHILLILDNLEHLLATSADTDLVIQIIIKIMAAPKAKLMVTSREALKLQSEWVFSLDGFDDSHMADAIALFLQSAGHAQAQFQVRAEDEPRIRRICQLVDGMPLGIELAASWINLLSLDEIGHEIEHSLEMLTTRMRDVPQRHRSITAVMDHSWQLLAVEEQRVMARLAVFRGSFTREMARQVADASLTTLAQLVSKSMLRRSDQNRYELHELMRQYAQTQLEQSGQSQAVQSQHATAFLAYIEANDRQLHGAESATLKLKLAVDLGNFRAAYQWASGDIDGDPILALKLAAALVRLYYLLPNWSEGNDMLVNALAKALASVPDKTRIEPVTLGRVELGLAVFQHTWGHYAAAVQHLETALAQFRTQPDQWYVAWTLSMLGQCFLAMNDIAACEAVVTESHELFQALGERWAIAFTTWQKAHVARAKADDAQAIQLAQVSLTQFRALNDAGCLALVHNLLGELAIHHRNFAEAVRHYSDSIGVLRNTNNPAGLAWTQLCLGQARLGNGQSDQAIPCFIESALLREAMGDAETLNEALQGLAICMVEQGNLVLAAHLFGAAARGWRGESFILQQAMFERFEQARNLARSQLGERRWQAEYTFGKLTAPHLLIETAEAWVPVPVV